eukprot:1211851-Amphidinium_carterae.1
MINSDEYNFVKNVCSYWDNCWYNFSHRNKQYCTKDVAPSLMKARMSHQREAKLQAFNAFPQKWSLKSLDITVVEHTASIGRSMQTWTQASLPSDNSTATHAGSTSRRM